MKADFNELSDIYNLYVTYLSHLLDRDDGDIDNFNDNDNIIDDDYYNYVTNK